jgi:hypothetical protein
MKMDYINELMEILDKKSKSKLCDFKVCFYFFSINKYTILQSYDIILKEFIYGLKC